MNRLQDITTLLANLHNDREESSWFTAKTAVSAKINVSLKGSVFEQVGMKYSLDPLLIFAIAIIESHKDTHPQHAALTPYTLCANDCLFNFEDRKSADLALKELLKSTKDIRVGLMQVHIKTCPHIRPTELLNPRKNLNVAASQLRKALSTSNDPIIGVGLFHTDIKDVATCYGQRVWQKYHELLQTQGTQTAYSNH